MGRVLRDIVLPTLPDSFGSLAEAHAYMSSLQAHLVSILIDLLTEFNFKVEGVNLRDTFITGLEAKSSPDADDDYVLLYDAAGNAHKKATPGSIAGTGPFLRLDQSTPQTVENGSPQFDEGLTIASDKPVYLDGE